jgi:CBS domain containing-hemolysin-like protein
MLILQLLVSAALVVANGFFVVAEFSLARVRPTQLLEWEREGKPGASSVRHAVERLDAYLSACQLGITTASLGLGAIGERALRDLLEPALGDLGVAGSVGLAGALGFGLITLAHVVAGELAPKSVAIARTEQAALKAAPAMRVFYTVTRPFVNLLNAMGNLVLKPFGIPPAREVGHAPPTEDELHQLIREAARHGLIDHDERLLAENALTFDDLRVRQIMVPRRKLPYVTTDMDVRAVVDRIRQTGLPRLPLCEPGGGLDAPVGLLHVKDLVIVLAEGTDVFSLESVARPLERVFDAMLVDELLAHMRRRGHEFVLVADERDTIVGGVALENIIDVIVGELEPEFDAGALAQMRYENGTLVASGSAFIHAIGRLLGVELADIHQATVGGAMIERLGRVPEPGDVVEVDGLRLEVTDVQDGRVKKVRIAPVAANGAPTSH